jgi:hypothetical protein
LANAKTQSDFALAETLVEFVDSAAGIQHFLLAGEEGVALGTYVDTQFFSERGPGFEHVATATGHGNVFVLGMDIWFHGLPLCSRTLVRTLGDIATGITHEASTISLFETSACRFGREKERAFYQNAVF